MIEEKKKTIVIPKLYPKQIEFCESTAKYTLFGGARGGGKSFVVDTKAILLAIRYPGINILLVRRTFPELRENHIVPLQEKLYGIAKYKTADKVFEFPNGSRIIMGYCNTDNDVLQYQGIAYEAIFMDEATHFTEFQFSRFTQSNRIHDGYKGTEELMPRMYLTGNPGGVGHNWVKRLFIDRKYVGFENPEDYKFIPSNVYDNEYLMLHDPTYVKSLERLPENEKKAMLYGDWNVFEGQMFQEFDVNTHVIDPFVIPNNWRIYRTRDYGLDMTAALWIAVSPDDFGYVFNEFEKNNLIVSEAGEKLNSLTTHSLFCDLAPPDLWNRHGESGKSAANIFFSENGHILTKANNDRVNGWLAVKEWLKTKQDREGKIAPKLRIFRNCINLIRCLPLLQYDEKNPCDAATEPHEITHITDALRYFCASWTYPPVTPKEAIQRSTLERMFKTEKANYGDEGDFISWE